MNVFFDTNVLVAASEENHPHHAQARPVLRRVALGKDKGFMGAHSIAEIFATLTRLPVQPRIHPVEAVRIIADNILPHFEVIPIGKKDYIEALRMVADGGFSGAKIYDALLIGCAARCPADRIYTFNLGDFRQLSPPGLREMICAP